MGVSLQLRRGTSAENSAFRGAVGELVYLTDTKELKIHDGVTDGGLDVGTTGATGATGGDGGDGSVVTWDDVLNELTVDGVVIPVTPIDYDNSVLTVGGVVVPLGDDVTYSNNILTVDGVIVPIASSSTVSYNASTGVLTITNPDGSTTTVTLGGSGGTTIIENAIPSGTALPTSNQDGSTPLTSNQFFYLLAGDGESGRLWFYDGTAWVTAEPQAVQSGATEPLTSDNTGDLFFNTSSQALMSWDQAANGGAGAWIRVTPDPVVLQAQIDTALATITLDTLPGTISELQIEDNAITVGKIETNAIRSNHILAGEIAAGHLAANSVTTGKILAGEVQTHHMTANAISGDRITGGTISASKIDANGISTDYLRSGQTVAFETGLNFGLGEGSAVGQYDGAVMALSSVNNHWGAVIASTHTTIPDATNATAGALAVGALNGNTAIVAVNGGTNPAFPSSPSADWTRQVSLAGSTVWNAQAPDTVQGLAAAFHNSTGYVAPGASQAFGDTQVYICSDTGWALYTYGSTGPFTGSHDAFLSKDSDVELGDILVDKSIVAKKGISDTISIVEPSKEIQQKGIVGVYGGTTEKHIPSAISIPNPNAEELNPGSCIINPQFMPLFDENKTIVMNSVGEGQVNVVGEGGSLEIGDLICTSSTPGKGMKQSDDLIHNYTVAKCRENVTFNSGEVKQVACIYVCG